MSNRGLTPATRPSWLSILATVLAIAAGIVGTLAGGTTTIVVSPAKAPVAEVNGTKLNAQQQVQYANQAAVGHEDLRSGYEDLPPSLKRQAESESVPHNDRLGSKLAARPPPFEITPSPLASPEYSVATSLVRNQSYRNGARILLLVVHDTESNCGSKWAIRSWFNNSGAQASSHDTTDCDGSSIRMVNDDRKAWTQAFFNPWSWSDELIGRYNQTRWPEPQLRGAAREYARVAVKYKVPIRPGAVRGCTIIKAGILMHRNLGACGGGHIDNGTHFPMSHFIALVSQYARGGPVKPPPSKRATALCREYAHYKRMANADHKDGGHRLSASARSRSVRVRAVLVKYGYRCSLSGRATHK